MLGNMINSISRKHLTKEHLSEDTFNAVIRYMAKSECVKTVINTLTSELENNSFTPEQMKEIYELYYRIPPDHTHDMSFSYLPHIHFHS